MKMNRTQGTRWWLTRIFLVLALLVLAMTPATPVPQVHASVGLEVSSTTKTITEGDELQFTALLRDGSGH